MVWNYSLLAAFIVRLSQQYLGIKYILDGKKEKLWCVNFDKNVKRKYIWYRKNIKRIKGYWVKEDFERWNQKDDLMRWKEDRNKQDS